MVHSQNEVALTPPMGWNSWNCYGSTITQEKIKIQADALVRSGLNKYGYVYIIIDDGWQGKRADKYNAIQGNEKFPDMQGLCDYIHSLGLKVGIYSTPWDKSYAGYTGGCNHEMEDVKQWAEWGIDFLKYDWAMNDPNEPSEDYVKKMRSALDSTGRKIIFGLSNSTPISKGDVWSKYANMWRTTGDIKDTWDSISKIGFNQSGWEKFAGPGHWNDLDMLVLGYVGWGNEQHLTRLTPDEQITHVTLWCMLASPLILGCDLNRINNFLYDILTNDEVLAINQDLLGIQGYRVRKEVDKEVWMKPLQNRSKAVALFNRGESLTEIKVYLDDIGILGNGQVRDLWHHKDLGVMSESFSATVNPHGTRIFVIKKEVA
jgi:alpha-galactosidase